MASRGQKAAATRRLNKANQAQIDRLNAILKRLPDEVRAQLQKEVADAASTVAADARSRAPVLTGNLKASIGWRRGSAKKVMYSQGNVGGRDDVSAVVYAGDFDARYAHLVEFGTRNAPAQPFFYPAIRANRKQIDAAMKGALRKAIRDARKAK